MMFIEKKLKSGYEYKVKDIFGTIRFVNPTRIKNPELLDDIFMAIFETHKRGPRIISGIIKDTEIKYNYYKKNPWQPTKKKSKKSTN